MIKKIDFNLSKVPDLFCNMLKKWFLEIKIQICFSLYKTKYFDFKNIISIFKNLEKMVLIYKRSNLFLRTKKMGFFFFLDRKTRSVFICLKNEKKIFL